jgi:hypothetical protein
MSVNLRTRSKVNAPKVTNTRKWPTTEEAALWRPTTARNLGPRPLPGANAPESAPLKVLDQASLIKQEGLQVLDQLKKAYQIGDINAIDRLTERHIEFKRRLHELREQAILPEGTYVPFEGGQRRKTRKNRKSRKARK